MIRNISRSLSARLLGIFVLTALVYFGVARLVYQLVLDQDYLREIVGAHISLHADYVFQDIGTPPDLDRARAITERVPVDIRIEGPGTDWASDPAFPQISEIPLGPIPIDFLGLDDQGKKDLEDWARNLAAVRFGQLRRHAFVALKRGDYSIVLASPKIAETPRPDFREPAIWFVTLVVLGGCYLAVRWLIRPIKWIRQGTARIGEGDLDYRIRVRRRDDLGELASDINDMADDVRDMLEAKRQMLLAISHELRSPLTRAKVALEFLENDEVKRNILDDIREMERLISDLLETERMNTGHTTLQRSQVDLRALLRSLVETEFSGQRGRIRLQLPADAMIRYVDEVRMRLVVRNLLENALRYTPDTAKPVEVELAALPDAVTITVSDDGPGIAPEHLPRLTEPFFRADPARCRTTGGFGLGLYLCRRLTEAHRGTLQITSEPGHGTRAQVTIPDIQPAAVAA
jgi:signal transduction histidine kinase